jgi:hypothetical protein
MGSPVRKEAADQFRVHFGELARVRRGEPVQVDPFLIAQAIALVMRECTVRAATGKPILWNEYRVVLARGDFDLVRSLQAPLERDLVTVLAKEAQARQADLVGALRVTVVFDEGDELPAGQGVVRVAFVPTEKLPSPRLGEMTVRFDSWALAGQDEWAKLAARGGKPADTVIVDDSREGTWTASWTGGEARLPAGAKLVLGRPHADAPAGFIALTGAGSKINKQQLWIAVTTRGVRIGRFADANPVQVNGQAVSAGADVEADGEAEISLSRGELVVTVRRR